MALKKIEFQDLGVNVFEIFSKRCPLLLAGDKESSNLMTIGWGGLGTLWSQPVCTVYVRPQRYTYQFMEQKDTFSVAVLGEEYASQIAYCGKNSGRDGDKAEACGFTLDYGVEDTPLIAQAEMVFVCRKLYAQDMKPECFLDEQPRQRYYAQDDYHRVYVGRVEEVYVKE